MLVDARTLAEVALTREEYDLIVQKLGREPTPVELGMFGAMWSEHCGYKNSKLLLGLFPTQSERVLQGPGENAGAVDIGDGLAVVMKIESHNHPSAIEPYQGAATGVGGIVRDIFTMGARPIALLDSLRFGPLNQPRNRYLTAGVVAGIGDYGNCIGVPTVGGEAFFAESYSGNPLVNAMCVGTIEASKLITAKATGAGNPLVLVGADTGRDGIHGATFASVELNEKSEERRPAVQVGNPFLEKLLIEACLELLDTDYIVGMQDLGAAGITSSIVESASKGDAGVDVDVAKVSRREEGMTPYEVVLSESQERMLVVVKKGCEDRVKAIFDRWELHSDVIGVVTDDGLVRVREGGSIVAEIPAKILTEPPLYRREAVRPQYLESAWGFDPEQLPEPANVGDVLLRLLGSLNIASKEWVYRQYDHTVQTNTLLAPGEGDAAVLRVKGTNKAIALATDCNARVCYLDPYQGGAIAVSEAARNVVCVGAEPLALTNCLNFGNPEKPDIFYQLDQAVRGMADACRQLGTPVISGNVSLYNETNGEAVYPTPVIGMLGLIEDVESRCSMGFKSEGDVVALLGNATGAGLGGSEYLQVVHGRVTGRPPGIDLEFEKRLQSCCLAAIRSGLLESAHDCSLGGLAVALAICCIAGGIGARTDQSSFGQRGSDFLFGEGQSRIVVSLKRERIAKFEEFAREFGVPLHLLGVVEGDRLVIGESIDLPVDEMAGVWKGSLSESFDKRHSP
ncbi:MAG: phosphoribosylformylglycinamidine synthase subunit PurL [Chloroflexi bacterium]|nr:phosphoribosylformylglycinamidine synthase subunit PurL [Chloroflexota bacterium]